MAAKQLKKEKPPQGFWAQYFKALRFYLVTGLMVWTPLIVTVWLTWWLFKRVGVGVNNVLMGLYDFLNRVGERVQFLGFLQDLEYRNQYGFLIPLALFLVTGFLTRYLVGRRIIYYGELILNRIPFIRTVYRAVQQIRDVFVNREGTVFQSVCAIEYPRKGVYAIGFVTSDDQGVIQEIIGKELIAVFMPSTPNPTTGFLMYLEPAEVTVLDISIEDAMKLIVSGGAYLPSKTVAGEAVEGPKWGPELQPSLPAQKS